MRKTRKASAFAIQMTFIVALSACSSQTHLLSRQSLSLVDVASSVERPDAVYCVMQSNGVFSCPGVTPVNSVDILVVESPPRKPLPGISPVPISSPAIVFGNILFGFNRTDLTPLAKSQLEEYIPLLSGKYIVLSGHTDAIGSEAYNDVLARKRAESIRNFLIEKGLLAVNIEAVGEGKCCYVASNDSEANRVLNRRVEIKARPGVSK